jgi:hypothetical protein
MSVLIAMDLSCDAYRRSGMGGRVEAREIYTVLAGALKRKGDLTHEYMSQETGTGGLRVHA